EGQDLLLAARQGAGVLGEPPLQDREAIEIGLERRERSAPAHQEQVLAHGQVVEDDALLRAVGYAERAPRRRIEGRDGPALEADRAAPRTQMSGEKLHQGALADAVAAQQAQNLARRHGA